ncbi:MAG: hypothetical protein PHQ43_00515 [Dehalococcoidales bacterium]|nr:hypothetical protein [Dehalococcoidales bacterium]
MTQHREWSEAEFAILLENPQLSDAVLAYKLRGRDAQEVAELRDMLHVYHSQAQISEVQMRVAVPRLVQMKFALSRLKRGAWTCSRCPKN